MSKVTAHVNFEGKVSIEIDTDDYPHYFTNNEARGGVRQLVEDVFFDEASLRGAPFIEGAEFTDAGFVIEGLDE